MLRFEKVQEMHLLRTYFGDTWQSDETIDARLMNLAWDIDEDPDGGPEEPHGSFNESASIANSLNAFGDWERRGLIEKSGTVERSVADRVWLDFESEPVGLRYKNQRMETFDTYSLTDAGATYTGEDVFRDLPELDHSFPASWKYEVEEADIPSSVSLWRLAFNVPDGTDYRRVGPPRTKLDDGAALNMFLHLPGAISAVEAVTSGISNDAYTTSAVRIVALIRLDWADVKTQWLALETNPDVTGFDANVSDYGVFMTLGNDRQQIIDCAFSAVDREVMGLG